MEATLIFPHHLFAKHPGLKKGRLVLFVEEERFFSDFAFHKQKLIFHRASMKNFEKELQKKGYKTCYLESNWLKVCKEMGISCLYAVELDDADLEKKVAAFLKKQKISLIIEKSPGFLTDRKEFQAVYKGKKQFRFETFYIYQRKKFGILLEKNGKPMGGKWSLDAENRKRLPASCKVPRPYRAAKGKGIQEATSYVEKKYANNPGKSGAFSYATTHKEAEKALKDFLEKRLSLFGDYEDAIVQQEAVLFHSCLSPFLNVGLLTPSQVLEAALSYGKTHKVPLNSLEGFVRQVVGWREFVRGVYHAIGKKQKTQNFFRHKRKLPTSFYEGTTGIVPIDETIQKVQNGAYAHHIERLMLLGNFFFLCEIDPKCVYRWFMELFIDAYDWVMVPNVYGMSQYADGGLMTTKPYFSSSHYVLKMSNYPKGKWGEIWDALFWRFMSKHTAFFQKLPRLSGLCQFAKTKKRDKSLMRLAETFLRDLS